MFSKSIALNFLASLSFALAAPIPQPSPSSTALAPLILASDFVPSNNFNPDGVADTPQPPQPFPTDFVVAFKPNTVKDASAWLDKVFTGAGFTALSVDEKEKNFSLNWSKSIFEGIGGIFDEKTLNAIRAREEVEFVQETMPYRATEVFQQTNAPWGIARLGSQARLTPDSTSPPSREDTPMRSLAGETTFKYTFDGNAVGEGVHVYVLDTGIRTTHEEFGGRADSLGSFVDEPEGDIDGHGSHCAGSVGGAKFGIAKKAFLHDVKVLGTQGGNSRTILDGLDAAFKHISDPSLNASGPSKSIISMSLGGPPDRAAERTLSKLIEEGVTVVVAAGNESGDAADFSPSRLEPAITVGATDINDDIASFSNTGSLVDIFAPGVGIISVDNSSDTGSKSASGTSMATPLVAGLIASFMSNPAFENETKTPADIKRLIQRLSTQTESVAFPQDREAPVAQGTTKSFAFGGLVINQ